MKCERADCPTASITMQCTHFFEYSCTKLEYSRMMLDDVGSFVPASEAGLAKAGFAAAWASASSFMARTSTGPETTIIGRYAACAPTQKRHIQPIYGEIR